MPFRRSSVQQDAVRAENDRKDEALLAEQGYKQELNRNWGLLHNFGVSFSIISIVTGSTTLFAYGISTGGPAIMTGGWLVVCFMTMFVALSMSEITSSHPTSGGPYFWAAMLAPDEHLAAFLSWITGWFNFLGQIAVTTGITFGCATLISTLAAVKTDFAGTPGQVIGIYFGLLASHGLVNTFGVGILRYLNNSSIIIQSLGVFALATAVVSAAPKHQSAQFVFGHFYDGTGEDGYPGWSIRASPEYVACIGILMAQYTITGYDASAHMSEETRRAAWSAPIGILTSVGVSAVFGFFLIVCLLFSIQDFARIVDPPLKQPVLQILVDVFGENGGIVLFTLIILCVWHTGLFSLTSNSRMMFAFARDRGIPHWFAHVDKRFQSPIRTIWLAAFLAFCLGLPSLGSSVAFTAATSIATIGLYISYTLPIFIGLIYPKHFKKGPFNLGRFSRPVALIACLYTGFIVVVFCLPEINPVNSTTLNYSCVTVGIVSLWAFGSWFLSAKKWYKGPIRQIQAEQLGIDIDAPGALEQAEVEGKIPATKTESSEHS